MPNEQHHNGGGRSRSKSRGKSQEPRSKSRNHGGGGGAGSKTTTTTTTTTGRRRKSRGREGGGGGQQHQQHEHAKQKSLDEQQKELDEKKQKEVEQSQMQLAYNKEIDDIYLEKLLAILDKYDDVKKLWTGALAAHEQSYERDKILRDYEIMSNSEKKKYDRGWKRAKSMKLQKLLKENEVFGLPTKNNIAQQYHAERKTEKAKQLALPAPPMHTHAHDHAAAGRAPRALTDIDRLDVDRSPPESQFSYDKELWVAQTHTQTRDSLRYL
jgi:hypothetical protein